LEKGTAEALENLFHSADNTPHKLRALWSLSATETLCYTTLLTNDGLTSVREPVRAWSARLLIEGHSNLAIKRGIGPQDRPAAQKLATENLLLRSRAEPSAAVRVAMISAVQRADGALRRELLNDWLTVLGPKSEPTEVQMLWYALSRELPLQPDQADSFLYGTQAPLIRRNVVRFVMSQPNLEPALSNLLGRIRKYHGEDVAPELLHEVRIGLTGMKSPKPPASWAEAYAQFRASEYASIRNEAEAIAVIFGDKDAIAALLKRITDTGAKADERRAAIELLAPRKLPDFAKTLHALLDDPAMRGPAIRALAGFPDADTPAAVLKAYPKLTAEEKLDAVQTLAARTAFARELLDAIEKGTIPRSDVPVVTARQVLALNDKATAERLEKVWGKVGTASKERAALVTKWKAELTDQALKDANAANGRMLFAKHCAACHKMFGEGQSVGPELTGSQRSNLDYILENVIDPSAVVPREFQMVNFTLSDDRVVGGIVLRETKDAVTVRTTNDTLTLPTADIVTRKQTPLSIMPEGLLDQMKPAEVRDLIAYLRAKEQVPVPK
jgi:putative heme-binding domain-containing protein